MTKKVLLHGLLGAVAAALGTIPMAGALTWRAAWLPALLSAITSLIALFAQPPAPAK